MVDIVFPPNPVGSHLPAWRQWTVLVMVLPESYASGRWVRHANFFVAAPRNVASKRFRRYAACVSARRRRRCRLKSGRSDEKEEGNWGTGIQACADTLMSAGGRLPTLHMTLNGLQSYTAQPSLPHGRSHRCHSQPPQSHPDLSLSECPLLHRQFSFVIHS